MYVGPRNAYRMSIYEPLETVGHDTGGESQGEEGEDGDGSELLYGDEAYSCSRATVRMGALVEL